MFSSRTPGALAANAIARAVAARRAQGLSVLDLTLANPTRAGLAYPARDILDALDDARSLAYEPSAQGLLEAREAVAAHHLRQGYVIDPAHIVLAGSTSEAYGWLFKLLCGPGDEALIPRPSYPLFDCLAALDSVVCREYSLAHEHGWPIDFTSIEHALTPRTRAILLVNPNNPTGSFLKRDERSRLLALAARHNVAIVSDEVFYDYASAPDPARVSMLAPQGDALVFTLSGLSKAAGLPQMKLGWIHVAGPAPLRDEALERLDWIADAYLPVSAPVQHAARRWLARSQEIRAAICSRVEASRAALESRLNAGGATRVLPSEGGWSAIVQVPRIRSEEEWALQLLDRYGVLVQPGYFYDFSAEAFLVVSLLPTPEDVASGADAVLELLKIL